MCGCNGVVHCSSEFGGGWRRCGYDMVRDDTCSITGSHGPLSKYRTNAVKLLICLCLFIQIDMCLFIQIIYLQ